VDYFDVIVIGQGYAGLTAAKLAAERGLRVANCEGECMGGLILNINELEPSPSGQELSGVDLASTLALSNAESGVTPISDTVTAVEQGEEGLWIVRTEEEAYSARNVILASGAKLRKLGVPGEEEYFGQGVSECADCDGPMYGGKDTVVVGGGDSAFQEALKLAEFADKVTIVMRGAVPRARKDLVERAKGNAKIAHRTHSSVTEVIGSPENGVEGIRIQSGAGEEVMPCAGVFIFIGLEPNAAFVQADVRRDASNAIITTEAGATGPEGLWAIGAVRSGFGGMLTDAEADAVRALAALS
jgi:thioredoxin reductase (NADPH)